MKSNIQWCSMIPPYMNNRSVFLPSQIEEDIADRAARLWSTYPQQRALGSAFVLCVMTEELMICTSIYTLPCTVPSGRSLECAFWEAFSFKDMAEPSSRSSMVCKTCVFELDCGFRRWYQRSFGEAKGRHQSKVRESGVEKNGCNPSWFLNWSIQHLCQLLY